jgi:serine phosphatase RsbU (regulator of sigma subunit)
MSHLHLRQILGRQSEAHALLAALATTLGGSVTVEDANGRVLHGAGAAAGALRVPVMTGEINLGWVAGDGQAEVIAQVIEHLVAKEVERRALGTEVLHLYREVNLIYSFSEKLAALLDVERVVRLTLDEARHLIGATDGAILLLDDAGETLDVLASFGDELSALTSYRKTQGIVGAVASTGVAEIVNDVESDARRIVRDTKVRALIAAPLKVGERVLGVIALGSTGTMSYKAAELKLLNTLALQTATAIENARLFERAIQAARERERLLALNKEAEIARARLEGELDLAARIQVGLFPAILPSADGYEIAARNRPARRCGGDYYDVLEIANGGGGDMAEARLLLCVADVAGKGLPAALVMANMQATLRALLGRTASLTELAEEASRLLYGSTTPEKYVTAALAELELASGAIAFVSAGHVDNLILRANGDAVKMSSTGAPLGLLPPGLPITQSAHRLEPGDLLVLFSDGVTEAADESDREFGEERLLGVLRRTAGLPLANIVSAAVEAIDRFAGGAPQFDDITMLAVRRGGPPTVSVRSA